MVDVDYNQRNTAKVVFSMVNCKVVLSWAASGRAFLLSFILSKVLRKKFVVMIFGSEVSDSPAVDPEATLRSRTNIVLSRLAISHADIVVCPSNFTAMEMREVCNPKKYAVVSHAVDTDKFKMSMALDREFVITVSGGQATRKGVDRFLKVASLLPNRVFVIIGAVCSSEIVRQSNLQNVLLVGRVPGNQLISYYQRARFYVQLSRHEGFGVAVAEAMACGCVPVVSDAGALPEVVGDSGFIIPDGNPLEAANLISRYWNLEVVSEKSRKCRDRAVSDFSLRRRSSMLRQVLSAL